MAINVEVEKTGSENNANLLRRFSKRVQMSGLIRKVKGERYKERKLSKYKTKVKTIDSLKRRKEVEKLIKMGKMTGKQ